MIVTVGSRNAAKVNTVRDAFALFDKEAEVKVFSVETGVLEQPLSLEKTVQDAVNMANAVPTKSIMVRKEFFT